MEAVHEENHGMKLKHVLGSIFILVIGFQAHLVTKHFGGNMFPVTDMELLCDGLTLLSFICVVGFFFKD